MQPNRPLQTTHASTRAEVPFDPRLRSFIDAVVVPKLGVHQAHDLTLDSVGTSSRVLRGTLHAGETKLAQFIIKTEPEAAASDPLFHEIAMQRIVHAHFAKAGHPENVCELLAWRRTLPVAMALRFVAGRDLASLLKEAAGSDGTRLADALDAVEQVAMLLRVLHAMPHAGVAPRRPTPARYASRLLAQATASGVVSDGELGPLSSVLQARLPALDVRELAVVHGDANATNFLLGESAAVAIDLERVGLYDPALDLGFLAAEILHLVFQYGAGFERSTPLLGTLFEAYGATAELKSRSELYTAMGLWRVARNGWVPSSQRRRLVALSRLVLEGDGRVRVA